MLFVAEMAGHLVLQRGLQHPLYQVGQEPTRTGKFHALTIGLGNQPLRPAYQAVPPAQQALLRACSRVSCT